MPDIFRDEIARIMAGEELPTEMVDIANPAALKWRRRPELDCVGAEAWETPDGTIVGCPPKEKAAEAA